MQQSFAFLDMVTTIVNKGNYERALTFEDPAIECHPANIFEGPSISIIPVYVAVRWRRRWRRCRVAHCQDRIGL